MADRTELLIDALVARVPVSGYDIVKTNVKPYEGQFHAYVLAKIPFDEFNSVMKNNKDELKGEFDGAFQALEARLNEREARAQASTVTPTQPGASLLSWPARSRTVEQLPRRKRPHRQTRKSPPWLPVT